MDATNTTETPMTAAQCLQMYRGTRDRYWVLEAARKAADEQTCPHRHTIELQDGARVCIVCEAVLPPA